MDIKKLAPWNWFKKEEEDAGRTMPVGRRGSLDPGLGADHPLVSIQNEFDRLYDHLLQGFGLTSRGFNRPFGPSMAARMLKPTVDIGSAQKEYTVSLEVPGVSEDDIKLELADDTLTISGEKKRENTAKDKNYYCLERSYGAFRRVLSLTEDVDQDNIQAHFKNGVLTITMPRKALPASRVKHIEVNKAA